MNTEQSRKIWEEKLEYLLAAEAKCSNAEERFSLKKAIQEAREKLQEPVLNLATSSYPTSHAVSRTSARFVHFILPIVSLVFVLLVAWITSGTSGQIYFVLAAFCIGPVGVALLLLDRRGPFYAVYAVGAYMTRQTISTPAIGTAPISAAVVVGGVVTAAVPVAIYVATETPKEPSGGEAGASVMNELEVPLTLPSSENRRETHSTSTGAEVEQNGEQVESAQPSSEGVAEAKSKPTPPRAKQYTVISDVVQISPSQADNIRHDDALARAIVTCASDTILSNGDPVRLRITMEASGVLRVVLLHESGEDEIKQKSPGCLSSFVKPHLGPSNNARISGVISARAKR